MKTKWRGKELVVEGPVHIERNAGGCTQICIHLDWSKVPKWFDKCADEIVGERGVNRHFTFKIRPSNLKEKIWGRG
jgi:hypothetical protein